MNPLPVLLVTGVEAGAAEAEPTRKVVIESVLVTAAMANLRENFDKMLDLFTMFLLI
jgi:hypothetical protein